MKAEPAVSFGRLAVVAAAVVIVLVGMSLGASVVTLVVFSMIISLLLAPLQRRLEAGGMKPVLALISCLAVYVAVLAIAGLLMAIGLADLASNLPAYKASLETSVSELTGPSELARDLVTALGDAASSVISTLLSGAAVLAYSVIVVAYFLLEARRGEQRLRWATGDSDDAMGRIRLVAERMRTFVMARAVLGLIAAVLDTVVLVVLGIPSALLWGVLSFLMSFIPNIGFIVALIPPTILALAIYGPLTALWVVVAYVVINVAIDYIIQPHYMGSSVDMSPLVVTVSILFWGVVLGPAGALLAVPLTIAAIGLADAFPNSRPVARLLVQEVPDPE